MIVISELMENDIGREVVYEPPVGKREFGRITSWNERFVFVKYDGKQQSQATYPKDLSGVW